jgi:hypothetical protein
MLNHLFLCKNTRKFAFLTYFWGPLEMAGFRHFLRTAQKWPFLGIFYILITFLTNYLHPCCLIYNFYQNKPNLGLFWDLPKKGPKPGYYRES